MKRGFGGRIFGGLLLLGIGGILLLNMMGIINTSLSYLFSTFWPMFIIFVGISQLSISSKNGGGLLSGFIILAIGGYFQARNLNLINLSMGEMIRFAAPILLIVGGLYVLLKPRQRNGRPDKHYDPPGPLEEAEIPPYPHPEIKSNLDEVFEQTFPEEKQKQEHEPKHKSEYSRPKFDTTYAHDNEKINRSGFIGDVRIGKDYFQLKPMNISHFIGDTIIDLTKAQIPYGETKINVSAFIGDVKVFIPEDMDLGITVTSSSLIGDMKVLKEKQGGFMSSCVSQTPYYSEASKRVKLNVSVFVGDVRVNSVG